MDFKTLQKDMVAAMKARDKDRKNVISGLVSAAKKIAIDEGTRDAVSEDQVNRAVMKELHAAKEQIDTCPKDRTDLLKEYQYRYDVIQEYAPKMMSEAEIEKVLKEKFSEVLATKNIGQIMKQVMPELKGKADGKTINKVVSGLCK